MKNLAKLYILLFFSGVFLTATSCREKTTEEKVEDSIEAVGDELEEGVEEIKDEADDAIDDH
ncbi:hypothetical protein [Aurantibacter sp.]|uniref:hypothetical protein n=1 Tax=Aurantibacter sp. TaxID=2807103 RepID=UPI003263A2FD